MALDKIQLLALIDNLFKTGVPDNVTAAGLRQAFKETVEFAEAGSFENIDFEYDPEATYNTTDKKYAEANGRLYKSKREGNTGNPPPDVPDSVSGDYENFWWVEISKNDGILQVYRAGLYGAGTVIVFYNYQGSKTEWQGVKFWELDVPEAERPFESEDIEAEIEAETAVWVPAQKLGDSIEKVSEEDAAGTSNDTDYLTVVKNLLFMAQRAGKLLTWNNDTKMFDFGGTVEEGEAAVLQAANGGQIVQVATNGSLIVFSAVNSEMIYNLQSGSTLEYRIDPLTSVKFVSGTPITIDGTGLEIFRSLAESGNGGLDVKIHPRLIHIETSYFLENEFGDPIFPSQLISQIIESTTEHFRIVKKNRDIDYVEISKGIDFSDDGPELIGDHSESANAIVPKSWIEAQIATITSGAGNGMFLPVANIAALKAIDTTNALTYPDKWIINVEDAGLFRLDRESSATDNGTSIIAPTVGVGRWLKLSSQITAHELLSNLQGGQTGQYYHLTLAQLNKLVDLVKASEAKAIAGTDDMDYMTALKVLKSMEVRSGWGLTWNNTTKKFELGVSSTGSGGQNVRTITQSSGEAAEIVISSPNVAGQITLEATGSPNQYSRGVTLKTVNAEVNVFSDYIELYTSQSNSTQSIRLHGYKVQIEVVEGLYLDKVGTDTTSVPNRSYTDRTATAQNITASRDLVVNDTNSNKINPVNASGAVILTIPPFTIGNNPSSWIEGHTINIARDGVGSVEISEGSGVTIKSIRNSSGEIKISAQYGLVTLVYEGANVWRAFGALES